MTTTITKEQLIERAINQGKEVGHVDVVKIASSLGIDVYTVEDGDDFNAKIDYDDATGKFSILVNADHPTTRQRFSIAHELAHYVLHKDDILKNGSINREDPSSDVYDPKEVAADSLAAEILIPEELIKLHFSELDKEKPISDDLIRTIAKYFNVSPIMAILRLRKLDYKVPYISFA